MLLKIGMVLAAVPLSLLALVAGTGVVVVDVHEKGAVPEDDAVLDLDSFARTGAGGMSDAELDALAAAAT